MEILLRYPPENLVLMEIFIFKRPSNYYIIAFTDKRLRVAGEISNDGLVKFLQGYHYLTSKKPSYKVDIIEIKSKNKLQHLKMRLWKIYKKINNYLN